MDTLTTQYSSKYTAAGVQVSLALAPFSGPNELSDHLPWVFMSVSCSSIPLDPPWTHFSLSKYASRKQYSSKYTALVVQVSLALAPVSGPDELSDHLPWVSISDSCSSMPLDPPWTHFSLSKYASRKQYSSKYTALVVQVSLALAPVSGPDELSDHLP
jgi:hypothetical protein